MNPQALTFGVIGFLLGGLVVSVAASGFDDERMMTNADSHMSMDMMASNLAEKTGDEFDAAFIGSMIEHHEGAIDMARLADKNAKHTEIKELSRNIIKSQQSEINNMKQWQTDWGYDESR
jgi:uncharacterized protein (DUF305 family)